MEPFLNSGGAFRPQIVKVGALSAPTKEILLKYSLDLPYTQTGIWNVLYKFFPIPSSSFMESLFFSSSSLAVA